MSQGLLPNEPHTHSLLSSGITEFNQEIKRHHCPLKERPRTAKPKERGPQDLHRKPFADDKSFQTGWPGKGHTPLCCCAWGCTEPRLQLPAASGCQQRRSTQDTIHLPETIRFSHGFAVPADLLQLPVKCVSHQAPQPGCHVLKCSKAR